MIDNLDRLINWHTPPRPKRKHLRRVMPDHMPNVACTRASETGCCGDMLCPRHAPAVYADCMARHAADHCPECGIYYTHPHDESCPMVAL